MDNIKVSIVCAAYNEQEYIAKVLDGFVNQKTNFKFEVLINDDASTDKTAEIIKQYEAKYPTIIKAIYQQQNQHSLGISNLQTHLIPRARGKYIAWCEGDDVWINMDKLQMQVDFLDNNPAYSMCVCQAINKYFKTGKEQVVPNIKQDKDFSTDEIICGSGEVFLFCTLMMRRDVYSEYPKSFNAKDFSDYQTYIFGSTKGKCRCLSKIVAVRNAGVPGSWSERIWSDTEERKKHLKRRIESLLKMKDFYKPLYSESFDKMILLSEFSILYADHNFKKMKEEPYKSIWKQNKKKYLKEELAYKHPWLIKAKRFLTRKK